MLVAERFNLLISPPAIRSNNAARLYGITKKQIEGGRGCVRNLAKPNSSYSSTVFFNSDDHESLIYISSAAELLFWRTNVTFIDLHSPTQEFSAWTNHRPTKLMQPSPCCLVAF